MPNQQHSGQWINPRSWCHAAQGGPMPEHQLFEVVMTASAEVTPAAPAVDSTTPEKE